MSGTPDWAELRPHIEMRTASINVDTMVSVSGRERH
jgi:hypothetical protein